MAWSDTGGIYALKYRGDIKSGTTDWDTLQSGVYSVTNSGGSFSAENNAPVGAYPYGTAFISNNGSNVCQIYVPHQPGQFWFRERFSSTNEFSAWSYALTNATGVSASIISSGTLSASRLPSSGVTAGSYGPTANVTGSNGATINIPQITVDTYGRVTSVTNRVYTSKDTNTTYSLSSFGVTATAAELNKLDGVTTTATQLNYLNTLTGNVQTQLNGKAASSHTHNYAGSSSAGGAANSVKGALTISLNGTSQGAYNGSAAKSINITAASIGAAASSHSHSYLPLGGGKLTGPLTLQPQGGSWLTGKTNAPIMCGDASSTDGSEYSPILMGKTTAGDVWNLGHGAADQVGFFGFYNERTGNGTDWSHYIKISDGTIHLNKYLYNSASIRLQNSNMNASTTATSATSASGSAQIVLLGSDGSLRGGFQINQTDDNKWGTGMIVQRTVNNATQYNIFRAYISRTGAYLYSITDGAAFRNALGLGNTTGALPVANGGTGATARGGAHTSSGLLYKIGVQAGTAAAPSSGNAGAIYIQYS